MGEIQVLVATMGQTDLSLAEKMNIQCDAILANQCDEQSVRTKSIPHGTVTMISTTTRGVGRNRNIALDAAEADIVLFADDDIRYYDGTLTGVVEAFRSLPQADVIVFGMDMVKNGEIIEKRRRKIRRLHVWNAMKYGAAVTAVRRQSLERARIRFDLNFGGGCIYGSGEDSLLMKECLSRGLKAYSHSYVLGTCRKDTSSWFVGYNEKFFFDKGALFARMFPRLKHIVSVYFAVKFRKETSVSIPGRIRLMMQGIRAAKRLTPYAQASGK